MPVFQGKSSADTVVVLLSEHPLSYAPAVAAELRLLRTLELDVQALPIAGVASASCRQGRLPYVTRLVPTFWVVAGEVARALLRNAKVACCDTSNYLRGVRTLLSCMRARSQSAGERLHWVLHFARAVALGDHLRACGIRRCHAHFTTNIALFIAEVFPLDISMTLHGPRDFDVVPASITRRKVAASSFVRAISRDGFARVVAASAASDHDKIVFIPLGVDLRQFTARDNQKRSACIRIVCVARLEAAKGHSQLLTAFALVADTGRPVELLLLGDGSRRKAIERQIQRLGLLAHARCLGSIDHERLPALLRTAHIFALASVAEGLPVALMEAMASGLACVATSVNGIPELIVHDTTGLLVPTHDPTALANALKELIDKPSLRRFLGTRARQAIELHYSAAHNARRLAAILEGVGPPQALHQERRYVTA